MEKFTPIRFLSLKKEKCEFYQKFLITFSLSWFANNNRKYTLNLGPMKMQGADKCRGKIREKTCESLQLSLITEQLYLFIYLFVHLFNKGYGNRYIGEVAGEYFSFFFFPSGLDIA